MFARPQSEPMLVQVFVGDIARTYHVRTNGQLSFRYCWLSKGTYLDMCLRVQLSGYCVGLGEVIVQRLCKERFGALFNMSLCLCNL